MRLRQTVNNPSGYNGGLFPSWLWTGLSKKRQLLCGKQPFCHRNCSVTRNL